MAVIAAITVVGALLALCLLVGTFAMWRWSRLAPLPPHLVTCRGCGRGFSSARALGWHSHAAHPFLGDDHHER